MLRAVRIAEVLFFPVAGFMLLGLPAPRLDRPGEVILTLSLAAEAFAAVAVFVGLGRRKRWAWWLALALSAWVLIGILLNGAPVVSAALAGRDPALLGSLALLAWTFATQAAALLCALALPNRRGELR